MSTHTAVAHNTKPSRPPQPTAARHGRAAKVRVVRDQGAPGKETTHTRLVAESGASASVEQGHIVVRSPAGLPVASYEPGEGLRVLAAEGDLTLAAPRGRVVIQAGTDLVCEGASSLRLGAPSVSLRARSLATDCTDTAFVSERFAVRASELVQMVGRWELRAERIVEVAKDAYRDVADLVQLSAGRMRTMVRETASIVANRTEITSEDDTVIDGNRVLLG